MSLTYEALAYAAVAGWALLVLGVAIRETVRAERELADLERTVREERDR